MKGITQNNVWIVVCGDALVVAAEVALLTRQEGEAMWTLRCRTRKRAANGDRNRLRVCSVPVATRFSG